MKARIAALSAVLVASMVASGPSDALKSGQADYSVSYNGRSASGSMQVRPMGSNWVVTLKLGNALASIDQSTVFTRSGNTLRPLGSSRNIVTPVSRKKITASYKWGAGTVSWGGDAKPSRTGPIALQRGDLDPVLLNVAIANDVAAGRTPRYRIMENGKARPISFRNLGSASLQVGRSKVQASKLFATSGGKQYVIWVAPGAALPARILQHEPGGDTIDMRMK